MTLKAQRFGTRNAHARYPTQTRHAAQEQAWGRGQRSRSALGKCVLVAAPAISVSTTRCHGECLMLRAAAPGEVRCASPGWCEPGWTRVESQSPATQLNSKLGVEDKEAAPPSGSACWWQRQQQACQPPDVMGMFDAAGGGARGGEVRVTRLVRAGVDARREPKPCHAAQQQAWGRGQRSR
eukprot:CAMPEP_0114278860 /NCGR_PEP_ID=MMETSP0059-20121206/1565_1 /TAXON_ID=36894 /ORGANISM="Pyramimonas parkeae, Strain CCMP726" /LENGTH=180 /DNA_ID=CAMNT_0001399093 /DNA_START=412 /DNA_END=951 /DNA_ORIENTATION=+